MNHNAANIFLYLRDHDALNKDGRIAYIKEHSNPVERREWLRANNYGNVDMISDDVVLQILDTSFYVPRFVFSIYEHESAKREYAYNVTLLVAYPDGTWTTFVCDVVIDMEQPQDDASVIDNAVFDDKLVYAANLAMLKGCTDPVSLVALYHYEAAENDD